MKKIIAIAIVMLFAQAGTAQAGCVKTVQNRVYDSKGKLIGFSYDRVYSSNCVFNKSGRK